MGPVGVVAQQQPGHQARFEGFVAGRIGDPFEGGTHTLYFSPVIGGGGAVIRDGGGRATRSAMTPPSA